MPTTGDQALKTQLPREILLAWAQSQLWTPAARRPTGKTRSQETAIEVEPSSSGEHDPLPF